MELCINLATDLVDITLIGPDNVWFGVGFDAIDMNNAYSIVAYDDGLTNVDEFILTQYTPGHPAPFDGGEGIEIIDSKTQNGIKTIKLQRARLSNENGVYSFPSTETTINVIFGKGIGEIYQGPMGGHSAGGVPLQLTYTQEIDDNDNGNGAQQPDTTQKTTVNDVIVIDKQDEDEFDFNGIEFSTTKTADEDGFNFNQDKLFSTLTLTSEIGDENDQHVDGIIPEAWNRFSDDIPAILDTMDKLKEARQVLQDDYDQHPNYDAYIDNIDHKIEELLDIYDDIYDDTRDLIELIRDIYGDGEQQRRLQVIDENDRAPNNDRVSDIDSVAQIEIKARQMFGGNRFAMMNTMQKLREVMESLDEYEGMEENKGKLKNKMEGLMILYNNVYQATDELIDLIKDFYLMTHFN